MTTVPSSPCGMVWECRPARVSRRPDVRPSSALLSVSRPIHADLHRKRSNYSTVPVQHHTAFVHLVCRMLHFHCLVALALCSKLQAERDTFARRTRERESESEREIDTMATTKIQQHPQKCPCCNNPWSNGEFFAKICQECTTTQPQGHGLSRDNMDFTVHPKVSTVV